MGASAETPVPLDRGALAIRLEGALGRASAALHVAAEAPTGLDLSALEAPLDKVVAEVAILAREAVTCSAEAPRAAALSLARAVSPLARAGRTAVAVALRPSVALDLAVGHILLSDIGLPDEGFQDVLARALRSSVARARERLPHRALEQEWLAALAGFSARPDARAVSSTAMALDVDLLGASRDDLYALTHAICLRH